MLDLSFIKCIDVCKGVGFVSVGIGVISGFIEVIMVDVKDLLEEG